MLEMNAAVNGQRFGAVSNYRMRLWCTHFKTSINCTLNCHICPSLFTVIINKIPELATSYEHVERGGYSYEPILKGPA